MLACLLARTACLPLPFALDPLIDLSLQFTIWFSLTHSQCTSHSAIHPYDASSQCRTDAACFITTRRPTASVLDLIECRHWHSRQPSHSSLASKRHQPILPLDSPLDHQNGFTRHCSSAGAALSLMDTAPGVRFVLALQLRCM
ncbi:hypothetical protein BC831DRAFT_480446 [Entophlyctis helioformis]|nr:hypothetical protein BC831DRAFT_480446 [Entophlyctis helioformis]